MKCCWVNGPLMGQSILKEINSEYSLEGLMLKLKLQYFGHLMWRANSLEKTLMLGKIEGRGQGDDRGWDGRMASVTRWMWVWVNSRSWWCTGRPGVLQSMGSHCISLNSFCDETSRTWASLGPETRYCGFWLGSSPRHVGLSPKHGFDWVWVPATWFKSQSVVKVFNLISGSSAFSKSS